MREDILDGIYKKLENIREEIADKIDAIKASKESYIFSILETKDEISLEVTPEIEELETKKNDYLESGKLIINSITTTEKRLSEIKKVLAYNPSMEPFDSFTKSIIEVCRFKDMRGFHKKWDGIASKIKVKYPVSINKWETTEKKIEDAQNMVLNCDFSIYDGDEKINFVQSMKKVFTEVKESFDSHFDFLTTALPVCTEGLKITHAKINEAKDKCIEKKITETAARLDEFDEAIDNLIMRLDKLDEIEELYLEYKKTKSSVVLEKLVSEISLLPEISTRDLKLLSYKPGEKAPISIEEPPEEETEIEKPMENIKEVEIDSDYFRRPETTRIICFLGTDTNSIVSDINYYFDKTAKIKVLEKISTIFNILFSSRDYISKSGGDPNDSTSKKTLTLLDTPFNFTYRRYGEGKDKFRIHAIKRHSKLLEDLKFGEGNIIFFGAVGPNDDNEKWKAYDRVGSRAVDISNGKKTKLQPTFDYIEHITRGYIPKSLLSDNDKAILAAGKFSSVLKGNIERSIEQQKYILYDVLDDTSKENVKTWLSDYFIEQTNKLFEIKDMLKTLKEGNTLD